MLNDSIIINEKNNIVEFSSGNLFLVLNNQNHKFILKLLKCCGDRDPFIKLNSQVTKGDTLLIIEAMKVMNTIAAPKSGKVVFIGFEDSQPVEFDQLLVVIE